MKLLKSRLFKLKYFYDHPHLSIYHEIYEYIYLNLYLNIIFKM